MISDDSTNDGWITFKLRCGRCGSSKLELDEEQKRAVCQECGHDGREDGKEHS